MDERAQINDKAAMFHSLEQAFNETDSVEEIQESLASRFDLTSGDAIRVMYEFITAKIAGEGSGGIVQLPEFDKWPDDPRKQNRLASWTWFYVSRTWDIPSLSAEKRKKHLIFRTHFEFGNTDEESEQLIRWADEHPGIILDLFEKAIDAGLLSDSHKGELVRARSNLLRCYLAQIHPERYREQIK